MDSLATFRRSLIVVPLLLALACTLFRPTEAARSPIVLRNNGYEGVVVAIGERVPEDPTLLNRIKEAFTAASERLFVATRRRASFREITLLVPQSWSQSQAYLPSTKETFDKANVVVDISDWEDNRPFTRQAAGCGQEGEFIYLSPHFFTNGNETGKAIVHEWGHLRWGLFDEYPVSDSISEHFYVDSNGVQPTKCNSRIQGTIKDSSGTVCSSIDEQTGLYSESCRFQPSEAYKGPGASYMYFCSLPSVIGFCDNDNATGISLFKHNSEAPNLQNKLCFRRSAWEVMAEHGDFRGGANQPVSSSQNFATNVTFKVKQRKQYSIVLVLDVSGSMATNNNHVKLDVAAKNYLRYVIPDGTYVGLVYFSSDALLLTRRMVYINDTNGRENLVKLLTPSALGGTSIGAGMASALQLIRTSGLNTAGSFMVVISDGEETDDPKISAILPSVVAAGVIIDSLLFTRAADEKLLAMSAQTGGLSFFYSGREDSTGLIDGLTSTVTSRLQQNSNGGAITVTSRAILAPTGKQVIQQVFIDKDLGKETRFTFSWSGNNYQLYISLTHPNGSSINYIATGSSNTQTFRFDNTVQLGNWIVNITNLGKIDATITMQADSKSNLGAGAAPVLVDVSYSPQHNFSGSIVPLTVYAHVHKSYRGVIGASVWATLESPSLAKIALQLRDSGSGADNIKDDGTYSGYFFRIPEKGTYSVSVKVEGTNKTALASNGAGSRNSQATAAFRKRSAVTSEPIGFFERVTSGDAITISEAPPISDRYPPARIQDLRVASAMYGTGAVTLEFTAVGDDYDEGRAHHYILKSSENYSSISDNFQNATAVSDEDIMLGNLSNPSIANFLERIVVKVKKDTFIAFSIVAVDSNGNRGLPSNVVTTKLTASFSANSQSEINNDLIIGLSVAGALLSACAISVAAFIGIQRRRKKYCCQVPSKSVYVS